MNILFLIQPSFHVLMTIVQTFWCCEYHLSKLSSVSCLWLNSFSVPGQGAADPTQLEEALCPGLGYQSEKGGSHCDYFCYEQRHSQWLKRCSLKHCLMWWYISLEFCNSKSLCFLCFAECWDGLGWHWGQRGTETENLLSWEQSWAAHQGSQTGGILINACMAEGRFILHSICLVLSVAIFFMSSVSTPPCTLL